MSVSLKLNIELNYRQILLVISGNSSIV